MKTSDLPRARLLLIAAAVAVVVTGIHRLVENVPPAGWIVFHAAVPAAVFSLGALTAGAGFGPRTVLSGILVVAAVASAFGWINGHPLPVPVAAALNFLVPLSVSTLGALSARRLTTTIEESSEDIP